MRLTVVHRLRQEQDAAPPLTGTVWATCVREVQFLGDGPASPEALTDEDAYALLLEIVSGLRSPLLGETEVQAQFKTFLAALDPARDGWIHQLGQRVLADVKSLRAHHLQGIGASSYADLALDHVGRASRLVVIGAGALARDVLQAAKPGTPIDLWSRRSSDDSVPARDGLRRLLIDDAAGMRAGETGAVSVIVAAPIGRADLDRVLDVYPHIAAVVDLRASDELTPLARPVPRVTLTDLIARHVQAASAASIQAARQDIRARARAFAARGQLRPFGWDDLCA